jgi:hypothetical protein
MDMDGIAHLRTGVPFDPTRVVKWPNATLSQTLYLVAWVSTSGQPVEQVILDTH